ncbi:hypothetical protein GCM10027435_26310 [Haloparvum alkalitolerans]
MAGSRTSRKEFLVSEIELLEQQLDADECVLDEGTALHEEGEGLLAEVRNPLRGKRRSCGDRVSELILSLNQQILTELGMCWLIFFYENNM